MDLTADTGVRGGLARVQRKEQNKAARMHARMHRCPAHAPLVKII